MFLDRHFLKTFIVFHLVGHIESDRKSNVMDEKLGLNRHAKYTCSLTSIPLANYCGQFLIYLHSVCLSGPAPHV